MKMRTMLLMGLLGFTASAQADFIETKKDGFLNGQIVSDDGKQVKFKDAKGRMHTYAKKDVLFQEKEDPSKKTKQMARDAGDWLKKLPENAQKTSAEFSEKALGGISQPLDRSAANAKADQLARALDDANRASASTAAKNSTFNKEVYRQRDEAQAVANAAASSSKKGRFSSLD